jgi:integrase/recombinase XerD
MTTPTIVRSAGQEERVNEAELAAAAFLARYQGRTREAYRYDLRAFFQWAADERLVVLSASRPQIELCVRAMEAHGLAATTIDRRLSTVCGYYRFAHIDGRIASNPAQYVRRPRVHPNDARGLDCSELGSFLFAAERVDHVSGVADSPSRRAWTSLADLGLVELS